LGLRSDSAGTVKNDRKGCEAEGGKMLIFKRPSEMEFRQVKRLLATNRKAIRQEDIKPDNFTILKKDDRLVACGSMQLVDSYGVMDNVAVRTDQRGKGWDKMIVGKLLETGPPTVWLTTDSPKFFEQFEFVTSKQMPKELARRLEEISSDSQTSFKSMVYTRKK
jgi:N-acetylglutamate synthase-like GNAT family acetyltransferase